MGLPETRAGRLSMAAKATEGLTAASSTPIVDPTAAPVFVLDVEDGAR